MEIVVLQPTGLPEIAISPRPVGATADNAISNPAGGTTFFERTASKILSNAAIGVAAGAAIGAAAGGVIDGPIGERLPLDKILLLDEVPKSYDYSIVWDRKVGDILKKGDKLATVYKTERVGFIHRFLFSERSRPKSEKQYYSTVNASVDGVLQHIFTPDQTFTKLESDVELALISTIPEHLDTIKIFYSYSSEDELLRKELEKQLSVLRRRGLIEEWQKGDITAGAEWQKQADLYLNTAHIILVLVSPDFMASDNCYSLEMQRAMQRHQLKEARVVPVLLRPTDWKGSPLAELQVLPADTVPITRWRNHDDAFLNVAQGIRKVVQEIVEVYLQHVQVALAQEIEQSHSVKQQVFSLSKTVGVNKRRLGELSREIDEEIEKLQRQEQRAIDMLSRVKF